MRALSRALAPERIELINQPQTVVRAPVAGWPGASMTILTGRELVGSRRVANNVDPIVAQQARLDLPEAVRQLRQAQIDEARLRPLVAELDRIELRPPHVGVAARGAQSV